MDRLAGESSIGAEVRRFADAPAVARASAEFVAETLRSALAANGIGRLALSGGKTPRATYELLAEMGGTSGVDWDRVEFFFGDERMVPPDDASSNYRMAREALFDRLGIPQENVHRMRGELGDREAARLYAVELGAARFDLVLLGMGDDGHVASLFPGSRALEEPSGIVMPSRAPVAPHSRVTVTMPVINAADTVLLIVTGDAKAQRLKEVFDERRAGRPILPAARVEPASGSALWFVDAGAAALLGREIQA